MSFSTSVVTTTTYFKSSAMQRKSSFVTNDCISVKSFSPSIKIEKKDVDEGTTSIILPRTIKSGKYNNDSKKSKSKYCRMFTFQGIIFVTVFVTMYAHFYPLIKFVLYSRFLESSTSELSWSLSKKEYIYKSKPLDTSQQKSNEYSDQQKSVLVNEQKIIITDEKALKQDSKAYDELVQKSQLQHKDDSEKGNENISESKNSSAKEIRSRVLNGSVSRIERKNSETRLKIVPPHVSGDFVSKEHTLEEKRSSEVVVNNTTSTMSVIKPSVFQRKIYYYKRKYNGIKIRFKHDPICPECRYTVIQEKIGSTTCLHKIKQYLKTNPKIMVRTAAKRISWIYPECYDHCHTRSCTESQRYYFRLDDVVVPFENQVSVHYLQSIDPENRIPPAVVQSPLKLSQYLSNPDNAYPNRKYLFEFNPSIVPLPKNQVPLEYPSAIYLSSYRVSMQHNCFANPKDIQYYQNPVKDNSTSQAFHGANRKDYKVLEFLGLAILDANMLILAETVLDIKSIAMKFSDPRLFVLDNSLYVASFQKIYPIWIVPPPPGTIVQDGINDTPGSFESSTKIIPPYHTDWRTRRRKNKTSFRTFNVFIRKKASCTNDARTQRSGKNLNYYHDSITSQSFVEYFPMGPKEVIDLKSPCVIKTRSSQTIPIPIMITGNTSNSKTSTTETSPATRVVRPSYGTTDELELATMKFVDRLYTNERGSACCVHIDDPRPRNSSDTTRTLLLGISHSKTRYHLKKGHYIANGMGANHFFSSFYAMESFPPYATVARSGRFCLSKPNDMKAQNNKNYSESSNHTTNPYVYMQPEPLRIGGEIYDSCPRIHFVSGMSEKVDDPSKVIIAYGVNDCLSRFAVLDKEHITRLLFDPHELIKQEKDTVKAEK